MVLVFVHRLSTYKFSSIHLVLAWRLVQLQIVQYVIVSTDLRLTNLKRVFYNIYLHVGNMLRGQGVLFGVLGSRYWTVMY